MHRILFTGTFYSGRTPVVNHFSQYKDIVVVPGVARNVLKNYPTIQPKPEFQGILLEAQICLEKTAESQNPSFIFLDRGITDIKAYSLFYNHQLKIGALAYVKPYDYVFLCSPNDIDVNPLISKKEQKERMKIHEILLSLLKEEKAEFQLLSGSFEERIKKIKKIIKRYDKHFCFQKQEIRNAP